MTERMPLSLVCFMLRLWVAAPLGHAKIHHLTLLNDKRPFIELSSFGFLANGFFYVQVSNLTHPSSETLPANDSVGFSFSKGDELSEALSSNPNECFLEASDEYPAILILLDFKSQQLRIKRAGVSLDSMTVCLGTDAKGCQPEMSKAVAPLPRQAVETIDDENDDPSVDRRRTKREAPTLQVPSKLSSELKPFKAVALPSKQPHHAEPTAKLSGDGSLLSFEFAVPFADSSTDEGEYWFIFHNCLNYRRTFFAQIGVAFTVTIVEKNKSSFLSGGDIFLPTLYFVLTGLFLLVSLAFVYVLHKTHENVFKIHVSMAVLVFIKTLAVFFHGVNFYFISVNGRQQEVWAVVYYIMHLLKGALLFCMIILIGTGWTFFKNFLVDRDRKLFMIVIPLQVIDNIALIIMEESEQGQQSYQFWLRMFIFIDLVCCAAIIFPVVWSVKHLEEASHTDGKAAFNLEKLKLIRQFYVIIICYIYLTRILKYLIAFTIPFKYKWMTVAVEELSSLIFYVLTGYKFKPAANNPYLKRDADDDHEVTGA